jgi:hypothetical protein
MSVALSSSGALPPSSLSFSLSSLRRLVLVLVAVQLVVVRVSVRLRLERKRQRKKERKRKRERERERERERRLTLARSDVIQHFVFPAGRSGTLLHFRRLPCGLTLSCTRLLLVPRRAMTGSVR